MLGVVGRERELQLAADFMASFAEGPAALVLEGEAGIGKTSVWNAALGDRPDGVRVLAAQPARAESSLGFAALTDLLEPLLDEVLPVLSAPQRHALAVALLREEPGARPLDQRAVAAATLSVLREAAGAGPLLLAIDDLQWLDGPTARVLEFTARRLGDLPVRVLACERINEPDATHVDLERAMPQGKFGRVRVGPLSLGAIHQVLKDQLGHAFPRRSLVRIEGASGGNPFFAVELGRALLEDGSEATELALPDKLRQLVDARIAGLPADAREALLIAAAAGSPSVDVVTAAMERSGEDALAALHHGAEAAVVRIDGRRVRFVHPLFAAGMYSAADPARRRRTHRRLAGLTDDIEEAARHLALGADGPDSGLASALDDAAEHARRRGAPEVAADLVEHARLLTAPSDSGGLRQRTLHAAEYHFHAGDLRRTRELLDIVLEEALTGPERAAGLRLLGDLRFHEDSVPEATSIFEQALTHAGESLVLRAAIHMSLTLASVIGGDFDRATPHAHSALEAAQEAGDPAWVSTAMAAVAMANFLVGRGLDRQGIEESLRLEDPYLQVPTQLRPSLIAGCLAVYVGDLEHSDELFQRVRLRTIESGDDGGLPFIDAYLVWSACWQGRLVDAEAYAAEGIESAARVESDSLMCGALAFAGLAASFAGEAELARSRVQSCFDLANRTGFNVAMLWAAWSLALVALSTDNPQEADAALEPATLMAEAFGTPEPARVFYLPDKVEALIGVGDFDRAERLLDMFEEAALRLDRRWAVMMSTRCRALLLAARGDLESASMAAADALELCKGLELRIEVARTFLAAGQIERRRRKKRDATNLLREALQIFEEAGARLWADRTRAELDRVGLRPAAPIDLTESERRVAELAASGLTNREVAAQLFISPKTVEANLARVYRKLGLRSRAELGAHLGQK